MCPNSHISTILMKRLKAGGEGDDRGWDGWMASSTQWRRVWASSGRYWRTGKPGPLQSMESQRVGHNWGTEQQEMISVSEAPSRVYKMTMINMLKDLMSKMDNNMQKLEISKEGYKLLKMWMRCLQCKYIFKKN